jgi:NitT/TauT family transport system permease protein
LSWSRAIGWRFASLISLMIFVILWEVLVRLFSVNPLFLPAPTAIGLEFIEISEKGLLWGPLGESLQALLVGLIVSILVGVPLGILVGASRVLDLISLPYLWALRATPRVAIAPLMVIWVGFGFEAKVWMIFLGAGVIILLITQEGVKTVDESLVRVARSFGASRKDIYLKVVLPYILPYIANAIRNGVGFAIVALLVVEMFSASGGLGSQVMRASYTYDSPRMFAFVIVLLVISLGLISISRRLEAYVSRWREEAYV